jgi:hypothetical protein
MEQAMMSYPKELEMLKRLKGDWNVEITAMMPDGSKANGEGRIAAEEIARGDGVHTRMSYIVAGGSVEEEDLWSFDRWGKKVHVFSVTSDHNVHDHIGGWRDDATLEARWDGTMDGKDAAEALVMTWESPDRFRIHDTMYSDGKATIEAAFIATRA